MACSYERLETQIDLFGKALTKASHILITAPAFADGDSVGTQLALRYLFAKKFPQLQVTILNDLPLPPRYQFMPGASEIHTPESFQQLNRDHNFDLGIVVDGGIDRAGRVKAYFDRCQTKVFVDHHIISCDYPYDIRLVEPDATATTELVYELLQHPPFNCGMSSELAQDIYLGLVFDTGFFRHSNTTPEAMELGAKLLREGFDFTQVGERGMLERTYAGLQLLSDTLGRAKLIADGKIIWSILSQDKIRELNATDDDREGIIDQMVLTQGIDVAILFYELPHGETRLSLRSHGALDVASFARGLTVHGGGHRKAAGANLQMPVALAIDWVLDKLTKEIKRCGAHS